MVGFKHFFLNDPNWPTPPAGGGDTTWLALMGVGRAVIFALLAQEVIKWIFQTL